MPRNTRSSASLRSFSGSDKEDDISVQQIVRLRDNVYNANSSIHSASPMHVSEREASSHNFFSNNHSPPSRNYSEISSRLGRYIDISERGPSSHHFFSNNHSSPIANYSEVSNHSERYTDTDIMSERGANSHLLFSNNQSPPSINYSEVSNHLGRYTAGSGSDRSIFTDSVYLDRSAVQYTLVDKFRWWLWRCTYLKLIKFVSFDVWLLSRFHKFGKHKVIFFLLLPFLLLLLWGLLPSISDSFSSAAISETINSVFSVPVMFLSYVFSSISSGLTRIITFSVNTPSDTFESCPLNSVKMIFSYIPSFSGVLRIFSGPYVTSEESASSSETRYHTKEVISQSDTKGSPTEEEIKLLLMKILKENNLFQATDSKKISMEEVERGNKLQAEIINLKSQVQFHVDSLKRIEETVIKQSENDATRNLVAVIDELKKHIDLHSLKLKSIETKLGIFEGIRRCCDKQLQQNDVLISMENYLTAAFKTIVTGDTNSKYHFFNEWLNSKIFNKEKLMQEVNAALHKHSSDQSHVIYDDVLKIVDSTVQKYVDSIKTDLKEEKATSYFGFGADDFSEEKIKKIVKEAIMLYDADKTGLVDYALESGGGSILGTRCSETYVEKYGKFSILGFPLWSNSNSPRTAIQPDVQPGRCWAFKGSQGFLVIELSATIYPTGFTMEHIPVSLSPTASIDSAPKNFSVWGLESEKDNKGTLLGDYWYDINGEPLQYFAIEKLTDKPYAYVELQIHSNHGNIEYTCLYRFRVHGQRVS